MAAVLPGGLVSLNHAGVAPRPSEADYEDDHKQTTQTPTKETGQLDYSQRAQWLRAAIMGAHDGLVSVSAMMMGVGAVKTDSKSMVLSGFAGSIAGACSMAFGEFVSVYTQLEVEVAHMKREMSDRNDEEKLMEKMKLPNPYQAAFASALSFSIGALVPLLSAAFIIDYKIRLMVIPIVATLALTTFGLVGAVLGKSPILRSCVRVVCGGLAAMGITFGLTKLLGFCGLQLYE